MSILFNNTRGICHVSQRLQGIETGVGKVEQNVQNGMRQVNEEVDE
jgi:hypothetical protein